MNRIFHLVSWPAKAGHPGEEGLDRRGMARLNPAMDTRLLDGPVKQGHDNEVCREGSVG